MDGVAETIGAKENVMALSEPDDNGKLYDV
jgi:hypothetical protein